MVDGTIEDIGQAAGAGAYSAGQATPYPVSAGIGYVVAKRLFDVVGALVGLVLALPLMVLAAVLIRLDSPGPVVFRQKRPGKDLVPFDILKFRTMARDAEAKLGEVVDLDNHHDPLIRLEYDPRVTRIGNLLRRTSLDELPQLLNVLRGEMSLVGPRPISRPISDPRNAIRLRVQPGLTGLWQISGRKNHDTDFMLRTDLEYLQRRSFGFDLWVLLMTVVAVLKADGAR